MTQGRKTGGRQKGTPNRKTVGLKAFPRFLPVNVTHVRALEGMRLGAAMLRELMVDAYNKLLRTDKKHVDHVALREDLIARIMDYIKAQSYVAPYEDPKLSMVKLFGDNKEDEDSGKSKEQLRSEIMSDLEKLGMFVSDGPQESDKVVEGVVVDTGS